ncbi:hypothetical protein ABPG74_021515 [Tetrahymena malaccensis]
MNNNQDRPTTTPNQRNQSQIQNDSITNLRQPQYAFFKNKLNVHSNQSCIINLALQDFEMYQLIDNNEQSLIDENQQIQTNEYKDQQEQLVKQLSNKIIQRIKKIYKGIKFDSIEDGLYEGDFKKKQLRIVQKIVKNETGQMFLETNDSDKQITTCIIFPDCDYDEKDTTISSFNAKGKIDNLLLEPIDNYIIINCFIQDFQLKECHQDEMFMFLNHFNSQNNKYNYYFDKNKNIIYSQFKIYIYEKQIIHYLLQALDITSLMQFVLLDFRTFIIVGNKSFDGVLKQRSVFLKQLKSYQVDIEGNWKKKMQEFQNKNN